MLIQGKRYEWPVSNIPADGVKNGLFTGQYDKNNGNALLMTKNGETWSVPEHDCTLIKIRHYGIKK